MGKQIKKVVGSRKDPMSIIDPETGIPLSEKQSAEHINNFFIDLTKTYPEVFDEWLTMAAHGPLPQISVENPIKKLKDVDANKACGPFDPSKKDNKVVRRIFCCTISTYFQSIIPNYDTSRYMENF